MRLNGVYMMMGAYLPSHPVLSRVSRQARDELAQPGRVTFG